MNLQQLIELAILDAMGLLDDDEQRSFESAYRTAAPAVQAQVRREQTRLSQIEAMLPDVAAPAGLRAAVLEAVRREIVAAEAAHAVAGTFMPPMIKSNTTSPMWRLASVALLAACVVLSFATIRMYADTRDIEKYQQTGAVIDVLKGSVDDVLFNRDTKRVVFSPAQGGRGEASVFINPEWKEAKLFYKDMAVSEGRTLRLALVDENDQIVKVLKEFTAQPGRASETIALDPKLKGKVAIMATNEQDQSVVMSRGELPGPAL